MSKKGMHPEQIKAAIRMQYPSVEACSLDMGYSASAVRNAFKRPTPIIAPRIAQLIGKQPHEIWPNHFDENNIPIRQTQKNNTQKNPIRHCKKSNRKLAGG